MIALSIALMALPVAGQDTGRAVARRYELSAADGLPGAYRVTVQPDEGGVWRFRARWEGRALAGLWVEGEDGKTLMRKVGPSPLELVARIELDGRHPAEKLLLRFATTTTRGGLAGWLEVFPPAAQRPPTPPVAPQPPAASRRSPAAECLASLGGETPWEKALQEFTRRLEAAPEAERRWALNWSARLATAIGQEESSREMRDELDGVWERLALDPAPAAEMGRAFRRVLASVEDLVRRESAASKPATLAKRRGEIALALACLGRRLRPDEEGSDE